MKRFKRHESASPSMLQSRTHREHPITRRAFLAGVGATAAVLGVAGCGGGNGSGSSGSSAAAGVGRTTVSGPLTNQVNQFSQASEQIGNIWEGQSAALTNLKTFANGGNRATDDTTRVMLQAVWYSLTGLRSGYERLANGLLAEDDQGSVATTVDGNNNLTGDTGTANPQWLAAMMLQTYSAFRVTGALMKIIQIAGVQQMQDWVMSQSSDADQIVAYAILADVFNTWVDGIQKVVVTPSLAAMKMDVSNTLTPSNLAAKLGGVPALLDAIPYGAGYRPGGNANGVPVDEMLTGTGASNFGLSFLGTLAAITLTTGAFTESFPQTVDTTKAKYDFIARIGSTGVGMAAQTIVTAAGGASIQARADALIAQLMTTALPKADGSNALCLVEIASGGYGVVQAVAQAILSEHSLVGDAIAGEMALSFLNTEISTINGCGSATQLKILASVQCDILYLQSTYLISGNTVAIRDVPVTNVASSVETDQIRDTIALLCQNMLCYPLANAGWNGKPSDGTIPLFRKILAGLAPQTGAPRTFNNAEISGAGLIYDLLFRYSALLKPDFLTNGQFIFCTSNFARLLRRSPGATTAKLPSITAAALLCSAPNFTPARSGAPVDLAMISTLGPLTALTTLVPGVPIHVQ